MLEANRNHSQGYEGGMFPFPEQIVQYQAFELITVDPTSLKIGHHKIYQHTVDFYRKLSTDFPPIVLGPDNEVIDGFHRVAAAQYLSQPIRAYKAIY
jgi:hypothetical protein